MKKKSTEPISPVVKWAGGKRQLLDTILPLIPRQMGTYCEPFLGGGAVLFAIQPKQAIVNDLNDDLINMYEVIRDDVEHLIVSLRRHRNTPEYYYAIRGCDRNKEGYEAMTPVEKASRFIYLNKTCYNGLYRVNAAGQFNTPFGKYRNPVISDETALRTVHEFLCSNSIRFFHEDFSRTIRRTSPGDFVYLDPPYDPVSDTSNFTGYSKEGFGREEQLRLKQCCDELTSRGVRFLLSNSSTAFIRELYQAYRICTVRAKRSVNSVAGGRGEIEEVLIRNYECE